nr:ribosomal protein S19 [Roya anglica]QIQ22973.1 ribosomal protein S19 [Roya anglica]
MFYDKEKLSEPIKLKIWSRRSCILPQFIDFIAQVYNGKNFISLKITEDMVGHKFGEFSKTRKKSKTNLLSQKKSGSDLQRKNRVS